MKDFTQKSLRLITFCCDQTLISELSLKLLVLYGLNLDKYGLSIIIELNSYRKKNLNDQGESTVETMITFIEKHVYRDVVKKYGLLLPGISLIFVEFMIIVYLMKRIYIFPHKDLQIHEK